MYEELVNQLRKAERYAKDTLSNPYRFSALYGKAADVIDELSKPRWIPVTERLPKPETEVMVAFDDGEVWCVLQNWTAQDEADEPLFYMTDPFTGAGHTVTHWMPLPQPPEEKT